MRPWTSFAFALLASLGLLAACGDDDAGGDGGDGGDAGGGLFGGDPTGSGAGNTGSGAGNTGGGAGPGGGCDLGGETYSGEGTYYDADGSGNCSFPPSPGDLMVAAMNEIDYAASASCGACIAIDGPNGSVTVRIVDRCPECPQGDVDMSPQAFELISPLEAGRIPITWRYVACGLEGNIIYHFKDGSNPYWTAVQVRNHRYPIAKFEVLGQDGAYREVPRLSYNYFVDDAGMGEGPFTLRVTDVVGNVIEDSGIPLLDNAEAPGGSQFPACQ